VCGLSNQQIQKRLLAESKLKFSKAVDIAVAMEQGCRKLLRARGAICYQKGIFFKIGQKQNERALAYL
jgi:hypothetical protein